MSKAYEYLKEVGTFFLATTESNGQPRLRPFGAVAEFENKLYIVTNNQKEVYKQLLANPKAEICAMKNNTWIRVCGQLKEDLRREAREAMMNANEFLSSMYNVDDNLMAVFYFETATAITYSFTEAPVVENL
ncbi:pyridoxamine 5'-phosphate oxidase family protein [Cellulosilyticum ruminicola]|uniref:pyridoxamine 5'-phosphate oxidase family protein n=1 Tax=Cellulosilyticum ruminicola TaxID=425254 RepID=UPI0006D19361|nr:pyridoxamine 5'-phosphate oxidase family protein [Cellulosilyticum ruminicola]